MRTLMSALALAAAVALLTLPVAAVSSGTAEAHNRNHTSAYKKHRKQRHENSRRHANRYGDLPPNRAIFSSQVDLRARGGVERFFELILEESR